jgi:glycine reductase complex component B subunit gamma
MLKVVHYLNQFFGGVGGEDKADHPLEFRSGPVGPGLALQAALGGAGQVVETIVCGDNAFHEQRDAVLAAVRARLETLRPDLLVAGPAFNAGRYGAACGDVGMAAVDLQIPAVVGLHPNNPAVPICRERVYVVPVDASPRTMAQAMRRIASLGVRIARREPLNGPAVEGYLPQGLRRHVPAEVPGARRAVDYLLAKLRGEAYSTDIPLQVRRGGRPAPPIRNLAAARIVLISTGGIVPAGNPDGLRHINEDRWRRYGIGGEAEMAAGKWEPIHGGYDASSARANPNVVVPLDALRAVEAAGAIGAVHDEYFAVVGVGAPVDVAERIGREIAAAAESGEIAGAILTST